MRLRIDRDERWPGFFPAHGERDGQEVELPDDFLRKWKRVSKQYNNLQAEMKAAWEKADGPEGSDRDG